MCAYLVAPWKSGGGATALQNAGALTDDERTARSVLECASPLALWEGVKQFSAERELSQLAAGGMTRDGWDDFDAAVSGDALRIGTIRAPVEPFSLGNGFRRDAENGNRDGRAPQQRPNWWPCAMVAVCKDPAKGSLGWTNGAKGV